MEEHRRCYEKTLPRLWGRQDTGYFLPVRCLQWFLDYLRWRTLQNGVSRPNRTVYRVAGSGPVWRQSCGRVLGLRLGRWLDVLLGLFPVVILITTLPIIEILMTLNMVQIMFKSWIWYFSWKWYHGLLIQYWLFTMCRTWYHSWLIAKDFSKQLQSISSKVES